MTTYTTDQLQEILKAHQKGARADFSDADLSGANLSDAYLNNANLSDANLSGANFSNAYLSGANLSDAYLSGANLSDANFSGANLSGAILIGANLSGANLSGADLSGAILSDAYLSGANLSGGDLSGAVGLPIATDAPARLLAVAQAALASHDALAMDKWHTCETTHCICGWAEHLGGPLARLIIKCHGNDTGGLMLLGVEAHAHFYSSNEKARAFLQSVIDRPEAEVQP
jgi:hypothetical protein